LLLLLLLLLLQNVSGFDGEGFNNVAMRLLFPWQLPEEEEATGGTCCCCCCFTNYNPFLSLLTKPDCCCTHHVPVHRQVTAPASAHCIHQTLAHLTWPMYKHIAAVNLLSAPCLAHVH
jgi:hypothetical protein